MTIPRPITSPQELGSGHMSPEAIMMYEQFSRIGNDPQGQAFQRVREADETQLIDVAGSDIYIGYALPLSSISSTVWKIKKINTNNPISIYYADGSTLYNKQWSARTTYGYTS
jgi:hypothetical protein